MQGRPHQSLLETLCEQLIEKEGLPKPIREYRLCKDRRWRGDFVFVLPKSEKHPDGKLVLLECEGGLWVNGRHNRPQGMIKDIEKYNYASIAGYTVIRVAKAHLLNGMAMKWVKEAIYGKQNGE